MNKSNSDTPVKFKPDYKWPKDGTEIICPKKMSHSNCKRIYLIIMENPGGVIIANGSLQVKI